MKQLLDYLNAIPVSDRDDFARRCGTSFDYLRQIGYGNRACSAELAIDLERESGGVLRCEDLNSRADWDFVRASK